jgi:farnesyl diphosphate synthase
VTDGSGGAGSAAAGARSSAAPRNRSGEPGELPVDAAFARQLASWQARIERALAARLPPAESELARLHAAMSYSVLNGGRYVRPLLLYAAARATGLIEDQVEGAACAVELVHAYSRVHDDLPAMDDDDLRRGKPTCHRAYDEGTAVLAGDALQSLAFQLLASDAALPPDPGIRLRLIELLADAIGAGGKAGGQAIEVAARDQPMLVAEIEAMYARKTGALIRASVLMAAACRPEAGPEVHQALGAFATAIGLALQIQDDLLEVSAGTFGMTSGTGRTRSKLTDPAALGPGAAQQRLDLLHAQALEALRPCGRAADPLRALTEWLLAPGETAPVS